MDNLSIHPDGAGQDVIKKIDVVPVVESEQDERIKSDFVSSEVLPRRAREMLLPVEEKAIILFQEAEEKINVLKRMIEPFKAAQFDVFIKNGFPRLEKNEFAEQQNVVDLKNIQDVFDHFLMIYKKIESGIDVIELVENESSFNRSKLRLLHENAFGSTIMEKLFSSLPSKAQKDKREDFFNLALREAVTQSGEKMNEVIYRQKPAELKAHKIGDNVMKIYGQVEPFSPYSVQEIKRDIGEYHALVSTFDNELKVVETNIDLIKKMNDERVAGVLESLLRLRNNIQGRKEIVLRNVQSWADVLQSTEKHWFSVISEEATSLIRKAQDTIYSLDPGILDFMPNPWITEEFKKKFLHLSQVLHDFFLQNPQFQSMAMKLVSSLEMVSQNLDYVKNKNKEFAESEVVLTHGAPLHAVQSILKTGFLASRAAQLEMFGEATFATALIQKMTPDNVTVRTQSGLTDMSWDEFEQLHKKYPNEYKKSIYQESHQLCFARGGVDWRFDDGVAFVFSEKHLLNKKKFMESDGIHVFDDGYKTGVKSSPGFSVDLSKEPFVIIVEDVKREEFLLSVQDAVIRENNNGEQITTEQWLEKHVVFTSSTDGKMAMDAAKLKLANQDAIIEQGIFYPTGERGENATGNQNLLFSYAPQSELVSASSGEEGSISQEKIMRLAEAKQLDVDAFLDAFQDDDNVAMQFIRDSGVFERITVREHTSMVLKQFEKYYSGNVSEFARFFMRIFLTLHDVGKAEAVALYGSTVRQHEITIPMMSKVFDTLGYPDQVKELAIALTDQDFIGDYFKFSRSPVEVANKIAEQAKKVGFSLEYFYDLIKMFYIVDAGSYTRDAGGKESLDFIFDFNPQEGKVDFSSQPSGRLSNVSPREHMLALDEQVKLLV